MTDDATSAARKAVEAFFAGFNNRSDDGMRAAMNFPHVRLASGRVRTVERAEDFATPFDRLTEVEGWHHSTLDACEVVHAGADKVHFDVTFSRYHDDGTRYATHRSLWVMTKLDGHWGVQARSSFAP
jgi:hypothetical protein